MSDPGKYKVGGQKCRSTQGHLSCTTLEGPGVACKDFLPVKTIFEMVE